MCKRKKKQKAMYYRKRNKLKKGNFMIKKILIIFTFVLAVLNIAKVEAMSILTNSEENQITKEYSLEDEIERGNSRLTIEVRDLEDCVRIGNAKVLVENKNKTWRKEYITDEEGFIYIKGLKAGEFNIQVLEIPEKYILDDMIHTVSIEENSFQGQLIGVYHKVGELLIRCNKKGITFEVITENCFGTYTSDDKGEVRLKNLIVGNCKITPYPLEGNIIGEPVETKIKENQITEVTFLNESENEEQEEPPEDNIDKEQEDNKDNEKDDKNEMPEEKNDQNSAKEENSEEKKEINENKENEKTEDNFQSSNKEENKIEKPAIIYKPNYKESNNHIDVKKDTENEEQEDRKEYVETEKVEDKEEQDMLNRENIEEEGKENVKNQSKQTKLPKTGSDHFEIKLIIFNSIIFIVFISIMCIHKKRQTSNSLPYRKNYKIIQINPPLPSLTIRSKVS